MSAEVRHPWRSIKRLSKMKVKTSGRTHDLDLRGDAGWEDLLHIVQLRPLCGSSLKAHRFPDWYQHGDIGEWSEYPLGLCAITAGVLLQLVFLQWSRCCSAAPELGKIALEAWRGHDTCWSCLNDQSKLSLLFSGNLDSRTSHLT